MTTPASRWLCAILGLILALLFAATPLQAQFEKPYTVTRLAEGVHAIVWGEVLDYPYEGNHLIIINDEDVVVVDANRTPSLTETVIREIRKLTDKPVRYLINTHWHADHFFTNYIYQREFPEIEIVAHPAAIEGMNRVLQPYIDATSRFVLRAEKMLASGRGPGGEPLGGEEREALAAQYEFAKDKRLPIYRQLRLVAPTMTVPSGLTLHRGNREIQVRFLGKGNTAGDLIVYLPQEKILATGDLVNKPYPFLGYEFPIAWADTLKKLLSLEAETILLGHGPVQTDKGYLEFVSALLHSLSRQAREAVRQGLTPEQAAERIDLAEYFRALAGDDKEMFDDLQSAYKLHLVRRAMEELTGEIEPYPCDFCKKY